MKDTWEDDPTGPESQNLRTVKSQPTTSRTTWDIFSGACKWEPDGNIQTPQCVCRPHLGVEWYLQKWLSDHYFCYVSIYLNIGSDMHFKSLTERRINPYDWFLSHSYQLTPETSSSPFTVASSRKLLQSVAIFINGHFHFAPFLLYWWHRYPKQRHPLKVKVCCPVKRKRPFPFHCTIVYYDIAEPEYVPLINSSNSFSSIFTSRITDLK